MSFLKKIFSSKTNIQMVENFLEEFFKTCGLKLSCDVESFEDDEEHIKVDLYGSDEELLLEGRGRLLKALQIYVSRVFKSKTESDFYIQIDSGGYLQRYEEDLLDFADRLKRRALSQNKPVILKRPLDSFYRRKIHQTLTEDGSVQTKSLGEGLVKTIKIFPTPKKSPS